MNDDFTVLMSIYAKDKPEFLRLAIKSVYEQTVIPNAIVIVEDGPISKELSSVIDEFSNRVPNIIRVSQITNKGLGAALELGSKYISTKWIARMDADDICLSDRFERELAYLKGHPDVDLLGSQIGEFIGNPNEIKGFRIVPTKDKDIKQFSKWRNPFNHVTVMIKIDVLIKAGNYQTIIGFEDYDLWNRVLSLGYKAHNLDEVLVKVRSGDELYKRRGGAHYFKEYKRLKKRARNLGVINRKEEMISCIIMFINTLLPETLRSILYKKVLRKSL